MSAEKVEKGHHCTQCGHLFDPHSVVATTGDPMDGGVILCPEKGCECYSTWGVGGNKPVRIPDRFEIATLRESLQA